MAKRITVNPELRKNRQKVLEVLNTLPNSIRSGTREMPNFLVIGAPKAGTTAINEYLAQHPEIYMSPLKNPAFFIWEGQNRKFFGRNVVNNLEAYHALFQQKKDEKLVGEASPGYLPDNSAPARIKTHIPNVKLVAILRNPIERAYSQFWFNKQIKAEQIGSFEKALQIELSIIEGNSSDKQPKYIRGGFYYKQLSRYLEFFEREQIHVILYEDFLKNPADAMKGVFSFLGADPNFTPDVSGKFNVTVVPRSYILEKIRENISSYQYRPVKFISDCIAKFNSGGLPKIPINCKKLLVQVYSEDVRKLSGLIQMDLDNWLN